jgi:hypothetical protein
MSSSLLVAQPIHRPRKQVQSLANRDARVGIESVEDPRAAAASSRDGRMPGSWAPVLASDNVFSAIAVARRYRRTPHRHQRRLSTQAGFGRLTPC